MPEKRTVEKARKDLREGKRPTTAAGEFVHEEMDHIRHGKHGARSTKQAIAIGLSKARRAGVPLKPPRKGRTSRRTRQAAKRAYEVGQGTRKPKSPSSRVGPPPRRCAESPQIAASRKALSTQAQRTAHAAAGGPPGDPRGAGTRRRLPWGRSAANLDLLESSARVSFEYQTSGSRGWTHHSVRRISSLTGQKEKSLDARNASGDLLRAAPRRPRASTSGAHLRGRPRRSAQAQRLGRVQRSTVGDLLRAPVAEPEKSSSGFRRRGRAEPSR
jgi:hypothetical protein